MSNLIKWDIYQINTDSSKIHGVKLRGRIRKFALENEFNLLTENATDEENVVRFAIETGNNIEDIIKYIKSIIPDSKISLVKDCLPNPVLSKMLVNFIERYD